MKCPCFKRFRVLLAALIMCVQTVVPQVDENQILTFDKHNGPVYALAINPDDSIVASAAEDRLIYLWDKNTGKILKTYKGYHNPVKYLEFSSDGRYLLSAAATRIRIWDLTNDTWRDYPGNVTHVWNVTFNRDASRFLSTSLSAGFNLWDREEAEVLHTFEGHARSTLAVAWSPDNKWIASGSGDRTIRIWDASTQETVHTISAHGDNIYSLDFSPDNKLLASASMDKNIKIWYVETGRIFKLLAGHEYAVVYVRFSPDGNYLVSASYDRTVKLWEVATGECIYTFIDQKDAIYAADFSPDGRQILSCSNDGTVLIYGMSPRFIAEHYFFEELKKELDDSGLLESRQKGESREEYQLRLEKAARLRKELYEKYYRIYFRDRGD